jgi:hypothetical protein
MVNFCAVCGCCTRTDIVREHLEDTLRICDVSAMGLLVRAERLKFRVQVLYIFLDLARGSCEKCNYRPLAHDVIAPVTMHLEDKLAIYA